MIKAYEKRRAALEAELAACPDVRMAADCLSRALEQIRLETRTALEDASARRQVDRLFETARRAVALVAGVTEADVAVQEAQEDRTARIAKILSWMTAGAGVIMTAWMLIIKENGAALCALLTAALGTARAFMPVSQSASVDMRATRVNAYELMRLLDRLMQGLEEQIEQLGHREAALPGDAPRVTGELLAPIQMLMEAVYTGDGDYALKAVPFLTAALDEQGLRLVEYSPQTSACFDLFPGTQPDLTIRPAVLQGDKVLARGQATQAVEELPRSI